MVPIWDHSCSRQLGWCLFGTVHYLRNLFVTKVYPKFSTTNHDRTTNSSIGEYINHMATPVKDKQCNLYSETMMSWYWCNLLARSNLITFVLHWNQNFISCYQPHDLPTELRFLNWFLCTFQHTPWLTNWAEIFKLSFMHLSTHTLNYQLSWDF